MIDKQYDVDRLMNMDRETVLKITRDHNLQITIEPDGSIRGLDYDKTMLRYLYSKVEL